MNQQIKIGNGVAYLALLVALLSFFAMGYMYYDGILYKRQETAQLHALELSDLDNNRLLTVQLNELQGNLDDTVNKLKVLSADKTNITFFQISELINLANQGLIVYGDVNSAIKLLGYAKNILQNSNNPMFAHLKYALSVDLARLNALPRMDKVILSGQIDGVIDQLMQIKLTNHTDGEAANLSAQKMIQQDIWHRFLHNLKYSLQQLIIVTNTDTKKVDVLLPQQQAILLESIRVNLLSAKLALAENDEASWIASLSDADSILKNYFSGYVGVAAIRNILSQLRQTNIATTNINIDDTIAQLSQLKQPQS